MKCLTARGGQSVLEYALLLSVLCAVFVMMFVYVRSSINARLYVVQERVNEAAQ